MDASLAAFFTPFSLAWLGLLLLILVMLGLLLRRPRADPHAALEALHEAVAPPVRGVGAAEPVLDARERQLKELLARELEAERSGFDLQVQPIHRLSDGRLVGGEVQLRWHHPVLGPLSPEEFMPVAERTGQILQLDRRVLEALILRLAREPAPLLRELRLALPVSLRHFHDVSLVNFIQRLCEGYRVPLACFALEVSERAGGEDPERIERSMRLVSSHGMGLTLGDFGSGQGSLRFLQDLPFSRVKFDRRLVGQVDGDPRARRFLAALVELSHALELECLAEGVETSGTLAQLQRMNCDFGQGYLLDAPMPLDDFLALAGRSLLFKGNPIHDA